ncbi:MAG TPA: hypothetical protein VFV05_02820 [Methylomirabilota bacterium]|nr:hypothetical protein [Methylomirabilota bacterium]
MAEANLLSIIKAKQAQVARLQRELEEARTALAEMFDRPASPGRRARTRAMRRLRRSAKRLAASPTAEAAATVLRAARRPLHVSAIQKAMKRNGHRVTVATLVGTLSRWVRSRAVFYRERPNVFGLLERRGKR